MVTDAVCFKLLYSGRLKVEYILESNLSPMTSGVNDDKSAANLKGLKEKHDLDLEEAELPQDVKILLHELAHFGARFPRQDLSLEVVLLLSLQENRHFESFGHIAEFDKRDIPVAIMFSGGLGSTYLLFRLQRLRFTEIHAVVLDVGATIQKDGLAKYAAHFGARFKCLDGRELFVKEGLMPVFRAYATYIEMYPISNSLSRPIIAHLITNHANALNVGLLLHTANLLWNSLPRLNNSIRRYGFLGGFGSPYIHSFVSRKKKAEGLAAVELTIMSDHKLSDHRNLWCREFEDGPLDDPENFFILEDA